MCRSLTPYALVLGPIVMFIGFMIWPGGGGDDILLGEEYLEDTASLDMNMVYFAVLVTATGVLLIFGGLFLLSQDLMANSGKVQRDLLLMSRIGFMFAFTVFYLFFALQLESTFIVQNENDDYASDPELVNELALDTYYMSLSVWSSMPIAWGTALILFSIGAVTGNNAPKEPIEWVYALPAVAGLGLLSFLWIGGDAIFFFAMFCALPIGALMFTGHLKDTGADSDDTSPESD
ncbi:MAG: hypothetical protein VX898_02910 [Candidatus Thermoplasmatota archaeon]|nr:hypothetical protein [Candidatus Thermoplasmatota archaeon]